MSQQPKYKFFATLLDSYRNMVESDNVWDTYWGFSENPPHTPEQFHVLQVENFIDSLNRVSGAPIEAASKGTAFNEIVDAIVEKRAPKVDNLNKVRDSSNNVVAIECGLDGFNFSFPYQTIKKLADYYKDAIPQYRTQGVLQTRFGDVLLYGYIDELMPHSVHDIKTTGRYEFPKFYKHAQHLVYPYCLSCEGSDIRHFQYDIVVWSKYGLPETYSEVYMFDPQRDTFVLRKWCEELISFLEQIRPLITDKQVFGGRKEDSPEPDLVCNADTTGMPQLCIDLVNDIRLLHKQLG